VKAQNKPAVLQAEVVVLLTLLRHRMRETGLKETSIYVSLPNYKIFDYFCTLLFLRMGWKGKTLGIQGVE